MITKVEAIEIVSKRLQQMSQPSDTFLIVEERTLEKPFGWVFFYNSKKFIDTKEARYRLAGNGPVIVKKISETVEFHGSAKPPEAIIKDYENKLIAQPT